MENETSRQSSLSRFREMTPSGSFKNSRSKLLAFFKFYTRYDWRQSFLSFDIVLVKCGRLAQSMVPSRSVRALVRSSMILSLSALVFGVGESVQAQSRKRPGNPGMRQKSEKRSGVGLLQKWFEKKDTPSTDTSPPAPKKQASRTVKIEELDVTDGSQFELDAYQPSDDGALQWSPSDSSSKQGGPAGKLGLVDLIEVALRNSYGVLRRAEAIGVAEKRREAERDWEDPQLRLSFSRDNDVELRRPYTTTETRYTDSRGRDITSRVERDNIKGNTTRERRIRAEQGIQRERIVDRVTPGVDGVKIDRTVHSSGSETRRETRTDSTTDRAGFPSSASRESNNESTRSTSSERTRIFESNPFDPTHPDSGFRIRVRFPIPNWLERKQRLFQAAQEIRLAKIEHSDERRKLIRDVKAGYEQIEYLYALDAFDRQMLSFAETFLAELNEQQRAYDEVVALQGECSPHRHRQVGQARADG